jgi:UDP-N-acetylmuramoylalanine-D-glutamate ligase
LDHQHDAGVDWFVFFEDSMSDIVSASSFPTRVLILGLGETGIAAARWCARNGALLRIADTRATPAGFEGLQAELDPSRVEWHLGCDTFAETLLDEVDQLVLSPGLAPGMSPVRELLEAAQSRNVEITGEIELFARALQDLKSSQAYSPKVLGVTGTNGKTTVTALTRRMLEASGLSAKAAGNISPAALHALMEALDHQDLPEVWVLELSSFQLETTRSLDLAAATVLNLTQDHLDWHVTMQAYSDAKARIFSMAQQIVLNRDDVNVMALVSNQGAMNVRSFGRDAPMLTGDLGIETSQLRAAGEYQGEPHRMEFVRSVRGVDFFNDSKGTNVGATAAGLEGLGRRIVLIAGGVGKGQNFEPLIPVVKRHVCAVVLIGQDATILAQVLAPAEVPIVFAADLVEAVTQAFAKAQEGDAVVLSPACASFDMFQNYPHRGQVFVSAVTDLALDQGEVV